MSHKALFFFFLLRRINLLAHILYATQVTSNLSKTESTNTLDSHIMCRENFPLKFPLKNFLFLRNHVDPVDVLAKVDSPRHLQLITFGRNKRHSILVEIMNNQHILLLIIAEY